MSIGLFGKKSKVGERRQMQPKDPERCKTAVEAWYARSRATADTYDVFLSLTDEGIQDFGTDAEMVAWLRDRDGSGDPAATTILGVMHEKGWAYRDPRRLRCRSTGERPSRSTLLP